MLMFIPDWALIGSTIIIFWLSWLIFKLAQIIESQLNRHHNELMDKIDRIINKL